MRALWSPRRRRRSLLLGATALVIVGALFSGACSRIAGPKGWASPVQSGDLLLVAHRDELTAFDAGTLEEKWRFPDSAGQDEKIDPLALYGTPALTDNAVYVPAYDGTLYALNPETGEVRWQFDTDGPLIGGVAASPDGVYFGSSDGKVYALNLEGAAMWEKPFKTGEAVQSTPTLDGSTLYVTSLDGKLYALDPATGAERWSFETDAGVASQPVIGAATGLVYVGGFDSRLRAIDLQSHQQRWAVKAENWFWTTPLVANGAVYAGSLDHKVYAADAAAGEPQWDKPFAAGGEVLSTPVLAGGRLIIVDRDGDVYAVNPEDGSSTGDPLELGSDVLVNPLVVQGDAGSELLVVTDGGEIVRIDPSNLTVVQRKEL
jgi:outer membrane protein assembly factor BamB